MIDVVLNAWTILRSRWVRTLSCGVGVALGCAVFVLALGLGQTAQAQVSDRFDVFRATTLTVAYGTSRETSVLPGERLPEAGLVRVRSMPGVRDASRYTALSSQRINVRPAVATQLPDTEPISVNVLIGDPHLLATTDSTVEGFTLSEVDEHVRREVAVVGSSLAQELHLVPGQSMLAVNGLHLHVVGVIRETRRLPELLRSVVVPESLAPELLIGAQPERVDTEVVVATAPGATRVVSERVALALLPGSPQALEVRAPEDPSRLRLQVSSDVRRLSLAAAGVVLVGGVIAIANLMQFNVSQRVREFGLRRAVGARPWQIVAQVVTESTVIGLVAGAMGSVVGLWALLSVCIWQGWSPVLDLSALWLGITAGLLGGAIGGLLPALLAGRIQPASALRL